MRLFLLIWNTYYTMYIVNGEWSDWIENTPCDALCDREGVREEVRICSAPLLGGDECTRQDGTRTTPDDREDRQEVTCENEMLCPG